MENKARIVANAGTVSMSNEAADRLIRRQNGTATLLYIHILRHGGVYDPARAEADLGLDPSHLRTAFGVLSQEGLVTTGDNVQTPAQAANPAPPLLQEDKLPEYTTEDIKKRLAVDKVFTELHKAVQSMLGKLLSSDDTIKLYGIYDNLGLPPEVILHLVGHCISQTKKRSGPGRMPTMRYIEKAAYQWEREGINSLEMADAHIRRIDRLYEMEGAMAAALQIHGRGLSTTERAYIASWLDMGYTPDAVAIAYDRTVTRTGRMNWKYIDSIMKSWHSKGLHSPAEIERGDSKPGGASAGQNTPQQSATLEDFERMKRYLEDGGH